MSKAAAGLWDRIIEQGLEEYEKFAKQENSSTLILIGAARSGKTTLIHSFLDKEEEPKPSLPIEFTYARKTNKHMVKDVCYIWEAEISHTLFIQQVVTSESLAHISVMLVVDLSNAQDIWRVCESVADFHTKTQNELKATVNYGMVGTKYDLYEDLIPEKKMIICRILKHFATILEANLVFCSKEDRTTMKVARDLFTHLGFNTKFSHQLRFDLNSPIVILKGGENKSDVGYLHQTFETQFGKLRAKDAEREKFVDPAEDPIFANEAIDKRWKGMVTSNHGQQDD